MVYRFKKVKILIVGILILLFFTSKGISDENNWNIKISASSELNISQFEIIAGVDLSATDEYKDDTTYDVLDIRMPPNFPYVEGIPQIRLYFPHPTWKDSEIGSADNPYWKDIRKPYKGKEESKKWEIKIEVHNLKNKTINISAGDFTKIPLDYSIILQDETEKKTIDIRKNAVYSYIPKSKNETRKLSLSIGKAHLIPITPPSENLAGLHNYPNPMKNRGTTFKYYLIDNATISLELFDFSGDRICQLYGLPGVANQWNEYHWNDITGCGRFFANGTYIYRITARSGGGKVSRTGKLLILR